MSLKQIPWICIKNQLLVPWPFALSSNLNSFKFILQINRHEKKQNKKENSFGFHSQVLV